MARGLGLPARGAGVVWRLAAALALVALLAAGALVTPGTAGAAGDRILVYSGNGAFFDASSFGSFGQAVGLPVDGATTLPASLAPYACVVLPVNATAFDQSQVAQFAAYLASGGRLIALGENSAPLFVSANAAQNALAAALGVALAIDPTNIDNDTVTTNIDAAPLTAGVASIGYASVSRVTVGSGGQSLVRTASTNETFIAAAPVGAGTYVLSGDWNVLSGFSNTGYSARDNGVFARNLCLGVGPTPAQLSQVRGTVTYGDTTGGVTARLTATTGGTPIAGATVSFTVNGSPVGSATTNAQGVASLGGITFPAGLNAGTYQNVQVCASFAGTSAYAATGPTCGPLVVGRAILWVKPVDRAVGLKQPNPPTDPHGDAACPAPSYCLELTRGSAFASGDTWAKLSLTALRFQYSRNPPSTNASEYVGKTYRITAFGASSGNYDIRYDPGTLTVR